MANTFVLLPAPVASGPGAEVNVSALGADKTIVVKCSDAVLVEYSNDDAHLIWSPVVSFVSSGVKTVKIACRYMRITIKDFISGVAHVSVGAVAGMAAFAEPIAPAVSGNGIAVATSGMPGFKTIQVTGNFTGVCNVEVSNDSGVSFEAVASFRVGESPTWSGVVYAESMRVRRAGVNLKTPGPLPIIDIAAVE